MFAHNVCGSKVSVKSEVMEYALLQFIDESGDPVAGDVMETDVRNSYLYCETCNETLTKDKISKMS